MRCIWLSHSNKGCVFPTYTARWQPSAESHAMLTQAEISAGIITLVCFWIMIFMSETIIV